MLFNYNWNLDWRNRLEVTRKEPLETDFSNHNIVQAIICFSYSQFEKLLDVPDRGDMRKS